MTVKNWQLKQFNMVDITLPPNNADGDFSPVNSTFLITKQIGVK